jgi:hypothetical protein
VTRGHVALSHTSIERPLERDLSLMKTTRERSHAVYCRSALRWEERGQEAVLGFGFASKPASVHMRGTARGRAVSSRAVQFRPAPAGQADGAFVGADWPAEGEIRTIGLSRGRRCREAPTGISANSEGAVTPIGNNAFSAEQFHAESWPNNAIILSRRESLWSPKRA